MSEPAAGALPHPAAGVLTVPTRLPGIASLRRALRWRRLPTYGAIEETLRYKADQGWMAYLWQAVFGETRAGDPYEEVRDFARRVDRDLFPVDLWATDQAVYDSDRPLWEPIYVYGFGVPWEVIGLSGTDPQDRPMVAVACAAGVPVLGIPPHETWSCDPGRFGEALLEWWMRQGHDPTRIPTLTWPREPEVAVALLRSLDPPLEGLDTLYKCVTKGTGNPFLDLPRGYWQGEYLRYDWGWYWDEPSIQALTGHFNRVRPAVERLARYYTWWNESPDDSARIVVEALVALEHSALYEALRDDAPVDGEWAACLCP